MIKEKAILVAIKIGKQKRETVEEYLTELEMLAETAGAETIIKIIQERARPDAAYYIGKGKAEEIAQLAEMNDAVLVIFDDDLSPSQIRNLEKIINKKIIDRSGLILDIFAKHARTSEAKTQVELAQLRYTLSLLTRAWTHLSKQYGGIGTKGPGETQIETDRRIIRNRISRLKSILEKIEKQQLTKSAQRQNSFQISLVGYTNAGKSTLLNLLTSAEILAEDKLFATLDSTTRLYSKDKGKEILISDTVGFIRKLPPTLVASFRSTLNVVRQADLILHVIDLSNPVYEEHIKTVDKTLKELKCDKKKTLLVFNKVDLVSDTHVLEVAKANYPEAVFISAERGINIQQLRKNIDNIINFNSIKKEIIIPIEETKLISTIYDFASVIEKKYVENNLILTIETTPGNFGRIKKQLENI
jgi:GTP-binding protein HflX